MTLSSPDASRDAVFREAWAYDLAFAWDIDADLQLAARLAEVAPPARVLVPACGTGRYALGLAERGFVVEASDLEPNMVRFARAHRAHPGVAYRVGDMRDDLGDETVDAAFTFCNSFRYLATGEDASRHLQAVRRRLKPRGVYVMELALHPRPPVPPARNGWQVHHEHCLVTALWTVDRVTAEHAFERATISVQPHDQSEPERFVAEQPQRLWTASSLGAAAHAAGFDDLVLFDRTGQVRAGDVTGRYFARLRAGSTPCN